MECRHSPIKVKMDGLLCLDCNTLFKHEELSAIRKKQKEDCDHTIIEFGYMSNPPKAKCTQCNSFFSYEEAYVIQGENN